MGGVVNIITKKGKGDMHGEVGASYGRFDDARGNASLSGSLTDKWGMALGLSSGRSGNYKTGDGHKYDNTHAANTDVGGTVSYVNENTSLNFVGLHRSLYDLGSPGDTGYLTPDDRLGMHYTRFSTQIEHKTDAGHTFSAAVYGDDNRYEIHSFSSWGNSYSRYRNVTVGTRLLTGLSLGDWGRFSLGLDYANIRDHASGNDVYQPDMRTDATGLFAEYRYEGEQFSWFSGVRYDNYQGEVNSNAVAAESSSKDYDHVSWSTGAVYWLTDWLGIKANVGTAFVAPTAMNLVGDYTAYYAHYVGNPDLKAEKSLTAEGGFEVEYAGLKAEAVYFQSWYKDRITYDYASIPFATTYKNVNSQRLNGFDLSLSYRKTFEDITVSPYINSEIFTKTHNGDGSSVTGLPHHSTVAGIGLGYKILWLDMNARFTGTQKQNQYDYTTYSSKLVDMDSYTVVNAKLTVHATDNLDVYCGVNNLTDRMYAVTLGYPLPGRAVYAGFTYKF
jgi:vitamin B12 transporter